MTDESKAAMPYRTRLIVVVGILVVSIVLDHATKWWAVSGLQNAPGQPWRYLDDLFRIQYAENTGAFLSLGGELSPTLRRLLLVGMNSLILLGVTGVLLFKRGLNASLVWGLALILGGGIGNLIDRIFRDGIVVDFMNVGLPWGPFPIRSGIFNVADLAIVGGLVLLLARELFGPRADNPDASRGEERADA